jgi:hypothetical protein
MVVVLAVGTVAIAATTPPYTQVAIPSQSASFRLDPEHPAALSRFVVRIGAEARAGAASTRVILSIDAVRPRPITAAAGSQAIGFIVASTQQGASALPSPSAGSRVAPLASPWQAEPVPGREGIDLPIACGTGPCERGFWLIAELTAPGVDEADVDWHVSGSLGYSGGAYPSGPAASIQLDPAILLAGPAPKLTASTPTESLDLGPDRPAAAREVEVRVGPEAITHNGGPLGALSVDLTGPGSTGGVSGAQPVVHLYPLARLGGTSPPGLVLPSPVTQGIDPFADCRPGEECVRRFRSPSRGQAVTDS